MNLPKPLKVHLGTKDHDWPTKGGEWGVRFVYGKSWVSMNIGEGGCKNWFGGFCAHPE